jgi:hypothetical protein
MARRVLHLGLVAALMFSSVACCCMQAAVMKRPATTGGESCCCCRHETPAAPAVPVKTECACKQKQPYVPGSGSDVQDAPCSAPLATTSSPHIMVVSSTAPLGNPFEFHRWFRDAQEALRALQTLRL